MSANRKLVIGTWSHQPVPVIFDHRAPLRLWSPGVIGLIGTLLLHLAIVPSALFGIRTHKVRPSEALGPGATLIKSESPPAETLILIALPPNVKTDQAMLEAPASAGRSPPNPLIMAISPDLLPSVDVSDVEIEDEKTPETIVDIGDSAERARLFGIYSGQMQARIERAWRRPRNAVNESNHSPAAADVDQSFRCQVQIVQDNQGNVQEILLPNCNGSATWQRSLVLAIQQSSPLHAPPSPKVFSHTVTLRFVGYTYVPGVSEGEYDMAPLEITQSGMSQ
jgi:hypothetical protein